MSVLIFTITQEDIDSGRAGEKLAAILAEVFPPDEDDVSTIKKNPGNRALEVDMSQPTR